MAHNQLNKIFIIIAKNPDLEQCCALVKIFGASMSKGTPANGISSLRLEIRPVFFAFLITISEQVANPRFLQVVDRYVEHGDM